MTPHQKSPLGRLVQMNRKGFTLIELLIVVVIIGILAAIAIPKFANTKEKAYLASMKSDLRNLVTAEEAFFADSVKYTSTVGAGGVLYATTSGVVGPTITVTADGWTARVSHTTTTKTCAIYVGSTARSQDHTSGLPSRSKGLSTVLLEKDEAQTSPLFFRVTHGSKRTATVTNS